MPRPPQVTLSDVQRIFEALLAVPEDGKFAVLLFGPNGTAPQAVDALNIQFSIEDGTVGLDWVLLAALNIAARDRVDTFFRRRGSEPQEREMNDVPYLRIEGGDLVQLCHDLLSEVFGVTGTQIMYLIPEGFDWPHDA